MAKLKILRTGETNINSTDIWRFSVHSDYPTGKIALSGTTTGTINSGDWTIGTPGIPVDEPPGYVAIAHNLGYVPSCTVSVERTSTDFSGTRVFRIKGDNVYFNETDVLGRVFSASADSTYIYVYIYNTVDLQPYTRTWNIHYIIRHDQT